jgi:peptidase M50-like protein
MDAFVAQSFIGSAPRMPLAVVYLVAVGVPVVLLHELGHALVAARRLGGPVHMSVGRTGARLSAHFRRLTMAVGALPHPTGVGGYTSFASSRASARDLLLVALAGPAASLLGFALAVMALAVAPASGVAHDVLWAAAVTNLAGVLNIVPLELRERREGPRFRTDGQFALRAMRAVRAFRGL